MHATLHTTRFAPAVQGFGQGSDLWLHALTAAACLAFLALWSPVFAVSLVLTVATGWLWLAAIKEARRGLPGLPTEAAILVGAACHTFAAAFGAWLRLVAGGADALSKTGLQIFDPVSATESIAFTAASTAGLLMPILASMLLIVASLARRARRARFVLHAR